MLVVRTYVLNNSHVDNWAETANQRDSMAVASKHIDLGKRLQGGKEFSKGILF